MGMQMRATLALRYEPDDVHSGALTASVVAGGFSGTGRAWFDPAGIKTRFLAELRSFPVEVSTFPKIEGGFYKAGNPDVLEHCFLRIEIVRFDSRGTPLVKVSLMSHPDNTSIAAEKWILQKVETRFLTDYAAIDRFATDVEKLLDGQLGEAVLEGEIG